jgi:hypothetical protein
MKRIIFLSAFILLAPTLIYAQTIFPNRGGTGTTTIPTTGQVLVAQPNGTYAPQATSTLGISGGGGSSEWTDEGSTLSPNEGENIRVDYVTATSLTATSTFPKLSITSAFNFLGTVITNVSTWFNGLFDTQLATKTTDNLTEGTTNKYNKISTSTTPTNGNLSYWTSANTLGSIATGTLTESVSGLQLDNTRGLVGGSAVLSLSAGFTIPTTTDITNWNTAFGWGNHALQGYLSTTSGNWAGTFDGLEGTSYLARANHTGTQLASTISDFVATVRTSISETITGIGYNNSTGVFTLDAGYSIPTTTDFTNWNTAFGWGNHASQGYIATTSGNWTGTVDGNNFAGGAIGSGDMLYGSGAGAISELGIGSSSTILVSNGSTPFWITGPSICTAITGGSALCDGDDATGAGGGITTLNGLINSTQTFAVGTSSNIGIGIVSSGSTHTFTPTLASGFTVPSTTDFTNWNNAFSFYTTPSSRITAGTNLSWSSNTLNAITQISTSSSNGNLAYWTGTSALGNVATGTLTESVTGLQFDNTRALVGGSAILSLSAGYGIPLTASSTEWATAYASTTAMTPTYTRGLFSNTATGLTYTGATGITALTAGYNIPLSASTTNWNGFYDVPSTRITAGANCSWAGNTFNCTGGSSGGGLSTTTPWTNGNLAYVTGLGTVGSVATTTLVAGTGISFSGGTPIIVGSSPITIESTGGGGGGGALSTTTDVIGDPATPELVSYVTGDVMFGGSASTSAEFQFDDDGAQLIISSTTNSNATATIESGNNAQAVRIGDDSGVGMENIFSTVATMITRFYGAIVTWIIDIQKVAITGKLFVATTTYNGATTSDALVIDGYTNSGEWIQEFCTSPAAETTQITADVLRGCGRYSYLEDAAGVLEFTAPNTGTSSHFVLKPGATGVNSAAGDGMGIGWAGYGLPLLSIHKNSPVMEWTMRQSAVNNATSTFVFGGFTDMHTVTANFAGEPSHGFYVIATSTTANWVFACNPATGGTTYVDTGIASSTTALAAANPFTHFRLEISGPASSSINAILKARTVTNQNMTQVGSCTISIGNSSNGAPIVAIGKSTAGLSSELHTTFIKFWYKQPVF